MVEQVNFSFDIPWCACGKPMLLNCNEKFFEEDAEQYFVGISNKLSSYIHQLYLMERSSYNINYKIEQNEFLHNDGKRDYRTDIDINNNNNNYKISVFYSDVKYVKTEMMVVYNPINMVLLEEDIGIFNKSWNKYMEYSENKNDDLFDEAKKLFNSSIDKYMIKLYNLVIQPRDEELYMYIVSNIYFNDDIMLMDVKNNSYEFKFSDNSYIKGEMKMSLNFMGIISSIIITKNNEELINKELNID